MLGKVSSAYTCWDEHVRRRAWGCLLWVTQGTAVLCFMVCTQQVCEPRDLQWWENDMASRKDVLMAVFTSCDKCVLWGFGGTYCRSLQGDNQGHVEAGVIEGMCGLCRNLWGYFGQSQLGNCGGEIRLVPMSWDLGDLQEYVIGYWNKYAVYSALYYGFGFQLPAVMKFIVMCFKYGTMCATNMPKTTQQTAT